MQTRQEQKNILRITDGNKGVSHTQTHTQMTHTNRPRPLFFKTIAVLSADSINNPLNFTFFEASVT